MFVSRQVLSEKLMLVIRVERRQLEGIYQAVGLRHLGGRPSGRLRWSLTQRKVDGWKCCFVVLK